jgi:hypothetical protein
MQWAIVGIAAGSVVGLCLAYVEIQALGHVNVRLTGLAAVLVALGVMGAAHESGKMKEPEAPPTLSLDQPSDGHKTSSRFPKR